MNGKIEARKIVLRIIQLSEDYPLNHDSSEEIKIEWARLSANLLDLVIILDEALDKAGGKIGWEYQEFMGTA